MRERVVWSAADTLPDRAAVLRLQGIDDAAAVTPRIHALVDRALERYLSLAEPRAVVAEIAADDFAPVFRGAGNNAPDTPLEHIYPRATRLALIAATIGPRLTASVRELFEAHDVALGCMLDAVGSAAADGLADRLAAGFERALGGNGIGVLAYSPGYCGWHVSGQQALFARLRPEDIGLTLNSSSLMQPLKSVSGVLVAGTRDIHRFRPVYPFCEWCQDKQCRGRMAAVSKH